jgi:hypothetical protein
LVEYGKIYRITSITLDFNVRTIDSKVGNGPLVVLLVSGYAHFEKCHICIIFDALRGAGATRPAQLFYPGVVISGPMLGQPDGMPPPLYGDGSPPL